jgi:hypothetical protein
VTNLVKELEQLDRVGGLLVAKNNLYWHTLFKVDTELGGSVTGVERIQGHLPEVLGLSDS